MKEITADKERINPNKRISFDIFPLTSEPLNAVIVSLAWNHAYYSQHYMHYMHGMQCM